MASFCELLDNVYSPEDKAIILEELQDCVEAIPLKAKTSDWYKTMNLYSVYPDAFEKDGKKGLDQLTDRLQYLKDLGIDAVHILPFFESPLIDAGFDVNDYYNIRKDLGGNDSFDRLMEEAKRLDIKILSDIVLNHVSNEHEWYKKAEQGNDHYRDFFVSLPNTPPITSYEVRNDGPFASYNFDGKEVDIRVIFPDFSGDIPHWTQGKDNHWYYSTFYPHQLDTDWNNPYVFIEFAKILLHWASKGLSFRLDAITFVGKDIFKGEIESPEKIHSIIKALNLLVKSVNSECVFLSEAVQEMDVMKKYFGDNDNVESELNYTFSTMNSIWEAMLTGNVASIWKSTKIHWKGLIDTAGWVNFIRNHDGLTLEFADDRVRKLLRAKLNPNGAPFMNGFNIAGRTLNFLDGDSRRLFTVYSLLASLPGAACIIYGDEVGKRNDYEFMEYMRQIKQGATGDTSIVYDHRDINRGVLNDEIIDSLDGKRIYVEIANILRTRQKYQHFFSKPPKKIRAGKQTFAGEYTHGNERLRFYVNLSQSDDTIKLPNGAEVVLRVGEVSVHNDKIVLGKDSALWVLYAD